MSVLEGVAVVFGVLCVFLTIRQNIWCWPTGLVQVALFIVIFYDSRHGTARLSWETPPRSNA